MVIITNAIRCNRCGDEIESSGTHQFVTCSCGTCSVDGGHEYLRRCAPSEKDFTDISIVETEKDAGNASSKQQFRSVLKKWCHFWHPAWCHAFRANYEICESYGKQFGFDLKTLKNTDFMQETDIADPFKGIGPAS